MGLEFDAIAASPAWAGYATFCRALTNSRSDMGALLNAELEAAEFALYKARRLSSFASFGLDRPPERGVEFRRETEKVLNLPRGELC
jgi:hypothetical protein